MAHYRAAATILVQIKANCIVTMEILPPPTSEFDKHAIAMPTMQLLPLFMKQLDDRGTWRVS
jgi:hypothetical protein